jgi:hypothetical protein
MLPAGMDGDFFDDILRQNRHLTWRRNVVAVRQSKPAIGAFAAGVNPALLRRFEKKTITK